MAVFLNYSEPPEVDVDGGDTITTSVHHKKEDADSAIVAGIIDQYEQSGFDVTVTLKFKEPK